MYCKRQISSSLSLTNEYVKFDSLHFVQKNQIIFIILLSTLISNAG